jgi:hypothetical protein
MEKRRNENGIQSVRKCSKNNRDNKMKDPNKTSDERKVWIKYLVWQGKVTEIECTEHSYAWSGKIPCTGIRRCIYCGRPE